IFFRYGEEKFSKKIAREIERRRAEVPIETTTELTEIITSQIPHKFRRTGGHPAKRVFQALRIGVYDELGVFERSLEQAIVLLHKSARVSVITFHSLAVRICKPLFVECEKVQELPRSIHVVTEKYQPILKRVNRKPMTAEAGAVEDNPRARSAKLRIAEKQR